MDDAVPSGDLDDRRETSSRPKTGSGPFPKFEDDFEDPFSPTDGTQTTPVVDVPMEPVVPLATPPKHKRSISGNFLTRLSFLRTSSENERPSSREGPTSLKSRKSIDDDNNVKSPDSPPSKEASVAQVFKASQTRKRKSSLRKTALLGGRRLLAEGRERKNSLLQRSPTTKQSFTQSQSSTGPGPGPGPGPDPEFNTTIPQDDIVTQPRLRSEAGQAETSISQRRRYERSDSHARRGESAAVTTMHLALLAEQDASPRNQLTSPPDAKSVTSTSYASTTDEDDMITFDRPPSSYHSNVDLAPLKPVSSTATSYFPSTTDISVPPHSTSLRKRSPLSHTISSSSLYPPSTSDAGHDYAETEYWGWIILFVTWLTFTVGMGSALEIWSWAWDVGETPYAPPELEDDPTLPIVGYYPALMVLTGVVAWVWITVAWVGMKYFRHAKVEI